MNVFGTIEPEYDVTIDVDESQWRDDLITVRFGNTSLLLTRDQAESVYKGLDNVLIGIEHDELAES